MNADLRKGTKKMAEILDVAIVGYGPTGQMMAALLGQRGHKVHAFERHLSLYALPRASALDYEIARNLQSIGAMDRYLETSAEPAAKYHWINGHGDHLMTIDWGKPEINGYHNMYIGFQPRLEDCINQAVEESGNVTIHRGCDVTDIVVRPDGLTDLRIVEYRQGEDDKRTPTGVEYTVTARYVVAADGGNSQVRSKLAIPLEDWGFRSEWLVVDVRIKRQLHSKAKALGNRVVKFDNELIQICDPKRPQYFAPLGKGGRRFEFALMPGETIADMERPEAAWKLLSDNWGITEDDVEIYRQIVYGFNSFLAKDWRRGNIFLIGDAAHGMPPYLGQGLNTGLRDVMNLAWKLDFVLRDLAGSALLDSYQDEREANARYYIEASLAVGAVSCTFDEAAAAERDKAFAEGTAQPPADPPGLVNGLLMTGDDGLAIRPAGLLGPQAEVRYRGARGKLDDLTDTSSFTVLAFGFDPSTVLGKDHLGFLEAIGTQCVQIGDAHADTPGVAADLTGAYRQYFDSRSLEAIVVRPDFYVFGGAETPTDLPAVVAALMAKFPLKGSPLERTRSGATIDASVG